MKGLKNIEDHLWEKWPPMRTTFRSELRAHLLQKAGQKFKRPSSFMAVFTLLFNHMKRYSFAYISLAMVLVFGLTTVFKTPLSAQEVLANALENSKLNNGIYHHKALLGSYEDGKLKFFEMSEIYSDSSGNYLEISSDPHVEGVNYINLTQIDELGDPRVFSTDGNNSQSSYSGTIPGNEWREKFRGEKIYCTEKIETEHLAGHIDLALAADDYSIYQLGSEYQAKALYQQHEGDMSKLLDFSNPQANAAYIKNLIDSKIYKYYWLNRPEGDYYVFHTPLNTDGSLQIFINAKNYQLSEYRLSLGPDHISVYKVLTNEYLPESDRSKIFNSSNYENLKEGQPSPDLFLIPAKKIQASGCYDHQYKKISNDVLLQLDQNLIDRRNKMISDMESSMKDEENSLLKQDVVHGVLTQGFHLAHLGWDYTSDSRGDENIYLPFDGVVTSIKQGEYNGGYGDTIEVTHEIHGKTIQTFYAHLGKIEVQMGQALKAGQVIGRMGKTGRTIGGNQLHFEVRKDGTKVDPATLWNERTNGSPAFDKPEKSTEYEPPLDANYIQIVPNSVLTQSYNPAHLAWDLALRSDDNPDIHLPFDGVVVDVKNDGWNVGHGRYVKVRHEIYGATFETLYAHLDKITVEVGQHLKKGEKIGTMGRTGNVMGENPFIHFEVIKDGQKIDPATLWKN